MVEKVCPLMGIAFDCRRCHLYVEYGEERRCVFEVLALELYSLVASLSYLEREMENLVRELAEVAENIAYLKR